MNGWATGRRNAAGTLAALLAVGVAAVAAAPAAAAPTNSLVIGEIERVFLNAPGDVYAGGQIVVGGHVVVIPRNLLIDLPANRVTLQQLFAQAPEGCVAAGQTGLGKADTCNTSHTGGIATIAANRTPAGDVIAGDVFIQKGAETVAGTVTYVDYDEGWFRLNGDPAHGDTGVMVRLNDPTGRHTVQRGLGCIDGADNCTPDARFALDADNYTNAFSTGVPYCIPSTVARTFNDALDFDGQPATTELTAQAAANGTGDVLCPDTNRNGTNLQVDDSRRLTPLVLGDWISVEGNFETIDGVHFLSAHSSTISRALQTKNTPGQPDYMYLEEAEMDAPGFQNQRARALFIGFASTPVPDVLLWSLHRDPARNAVHEFPLATTRGCDLAGGGCTGFGVGLFKIRYDADFIQQPTSPKLSPCAQLRNDQRIGRGFCASGDTTADDEFAVLSPIPHEIQGRTGRKLADTTGSLRTFDVHGNEATNGQYLFPFGIGLGGVTMPEMAEFNINALSSPNIFEGIPWLLDRRLSPGGCQAGGCEGGPQPLDPFPYSGLDPRTQAANVIVPGGAVPSGAVTDLNYTASRLSNAQNRIVSYVDPAVNNFNGDSSLLNPFPAQPASLGITPTPPLAGAASLITGFTPTAGTPFTTVQIGGVGLDAATAVSFNGTSALFTVLSGGRIAAVVPPAATTGPISINLAGATAPIETATSFIVNGSGGGTPSVTLVTPANGPVGTSLTITGANLASVTAVSFATAAGGRVNAPSFAIGSGGASLTVNVPATAATGLVTLQSTAGSADAGAFTVDASQAPVIDAFTPASGPPGTVVTITGPGLGGVTDVLFGAQVSTTVHVVDATTVTAVVPAGSVTAPLEARSTSGNATTTASFTVEPLPSAPVADAGPTQIVPQGSTVTLDASATTGATSVAWTQTSGPTVTLSSITATKPTFTFPAAFTNVSFQVTASNLGGTSVAFVTVFAIPDAINVSLAEYRTGSSRWNIVGTATIIDPTNVVTVRAGSITGPIIGSAVPDAAGNWTVTVQPSTVAQRPQVVVTSVRGGQTTASVTVRA